MDKKRFVVLMVLLFCLSISGIPRSPEIQANSVWARPEIIPLPVTVTGVANPVISLNGTWKFTMSPPGSFWQNSVDPSSWSDISVPAECVMQGFNISQGVEYPYKKSISIPSDFSGKRIKLRFDGVYSYARVWVNGTYVRDHNGGFTTWECDITSYVTPGQPAWITIGVTDNANDPSQESRYAHHNIGGILGNIKLVALPANYASRCQVETDLDTSYVNATLKVTAGMVFNGGSSATVNLTLKNPQGGTVTINPSSINLTSGTPEATVNIPVTAPQKWDAEHPNLYTLDASIVVSGSTVETISKKIGFREVVKNGNKVYVNGKEIKLRGGCHHNVHPTLGRMANDTLDQNDVLLFREANFNFVRTSHYPPSEKFLEFCDQYGMFVQEESAVCFADGTINDPNYTPHYMNQFTEMIERDRSHPSVIIWSLGNETNWGTNYQKELDYVRLEDTTRPLIVSWGSSNVDIYSNHYPGWNSNFSSAGMPRLNDEFAHVSCYNTATLRRDPGVRNFWGESIKIFWNGMFPADGCLGGAIWATTDEVFMTPINNWCGGYGEWGPIDGWRRKKPEHWLTQKAYSPIRIDDIPQTNPGSGNPLNIGIKNWFDFTNFNELTINWNAGSDAGAITNLNIAPHSNGTLTIPTRNWQYGDVLNLKFYRPGSLLVDEYNLVIGYPQKSFPGVQGPTPSITENSSSITISGSNFSLVFSKTSGLVTSGTYNGSAIIVGGPFLNFGNASLSAWSLSSITKTTETNQAVVNISGSYGSVAANFVVKIDGNGLITTTYTVTNPPSTYCEMGVAYKLSSSVDRLTWDRKGLWSVYPADHIGRNTGTAYKIRSSGTDTYRVQPTWSWGEDMKDFFLYGSGDTGGRGTNDFRSQKEYIWYASAVLGGSNNRLRAESDATAAVRAVVESDGIRFNVNNLWAYTDVDWGNYENSIFVPSGYSNTVKVRLTSNDTYTVTYAPGPTATPTPSPTPTPDPNAVKVDDKDASITYSGTWPDFSDPGDYLGTEKFNNTANSYAQFTFTGVAVRWISPTNSNMGKADVYLDGILDASGIDCYSASKIYQQILYSKSNLANTSHTIKVVVTGSKNPGSSDIFLVNDAFEYTKGSSSTATPTPTPTATPVSGTITVNDNVTGTGNNQFEYAGSWSYGIQIGAYMDDNHWSNTLNDYFQVRFNGTQISWYGCKAPNCGIGAASIDGGAESNVDQYATGRSDNVLLYTSPVLASGPHTLKVRVTRTKNASSSEYWITADRVDISNATPTPTPTPTPTATSVPGNSASYLGTDTTTQGTWKSVYGVDGYDIRGSGASLPSYATISYPDGADYTWSSSTTEVRALQKPNPATDRIAACRFSGTTEIIDLNVSGGTAKNVEIYLLDWDSSSRSMTVDALDGDLGTTLNTQTVSSFNNGKYLKYSVKGHIKFRFTRTAGANAVFSGVFFN